MHQKYNVCNSDDILSFYSYSKKPILRNVRFEVGKFCFLTCFKKYVTLPEMSDWTLKVDAKLLLPVGGRPEG